MSSMRGTLCRVRKRWTTGLLRRRVVALAAQTRAEAFGTGIISPIQSAFAYVPLTIMNSEPLPTSFVSPMHADHTLTQLTEILQLKCDLTALGAHHELASVCHDPPSHLCLNLTKSSIRQ